MEWSVPLAMKNGRICFIYSYSSLSGIFQTQGLGRGLALIYNHLISPASPIRLPDFMAPIVAPNRPAPVV